VSTTEAIDWVRIGEAIVAARVDRGYSRQEDAAEAANIGVTSLRNLENAKKDDYTPRILRNVEKLFGWERGTIIAIGRGAAIPEDRPDLLDRISKIEADVADIAARLAELEQPVGYPQLAAASGGPASVVKRGSRAKRPSPDPEDEPHT